MEAPTTVRRLVPLAAALLVTALVGCASGDEDASSGNDALSAGDDHGDVNGTPYPPAGACEEALHAGSREAAALATFGQCVAARNDTYVKDLADRQERGGVFTSDDAASLSAAVRSIRAATHDLCQTASDASPVGSDDALVAASCGAMREVNLGKLFAAYPAKGVSAAAIPPDEKDFPDCFPAQPATDAFTASTDYQLCTLVRLVNGIGALADVITSRPGSPSDDAAKNAVSQKVFAGQKGYKALCRALGPAVAGAHGSGSVAPFLRCLGDADILTFREMNDSDKP